MFPTLWISCTARVENYQVLWAFLPPISEECVLLVFFKDFGHLAP